MLSELLITAICKIKLLELFANINLKNEGKSGILTTRCNNDTMYTI